MGVPLRDTELEEISADGAFAILGNETRIGILRELWRVEGPTSFADLRQRVAPDDKGNFNYHLSKLNDHFIRKTEEGYVLRFAGEQVVRAVLSGTITADPTIPSAETEERCLFCKAPVEMEYEGEVISVRCTDCGGVIGQGHPPGTYMHFEFPPAGLVGRTREAAIEAAHVLYDSKFAPMIKGVCPECAGSISVTHDVCSDHSIGDSGLCPNCDTRYEVWSTYVCDHCHYKRRTVMWFAAVNHPTVISFFEDYGLDEAVPIGKLTMKNARYFRSITGDVRQTDPYRFRVTIPIDDDQLVVDLDENLDVLNVDRPKYDD